MRSTVTHQRVTLAVVAVCLVWTLTPATAVAAPAATSTAAAPATAVVPATTPTATAQTPVENPCVGTMTQPADGMTVISVQGHNESGKQPAKLVGVGPSGEILWVHQNGEEFGVLWGYDVDPMANGNLFVTAALRGGTTMVYEFNPRTQERVWTEEFDISDTHDADLINNGSEIVVANMRNYNESTEENEDRIFVYNRTTEQIEWEWRFDDHYDPEVGGNFSNDWTHVNDVDKIGPNRYLASPRNFDQVIVINRTTGDIEMQLGEDGTFSTLEKQHNPDWLESEDGTPTVIVADSENNRIVEYARDDDGWNRTWTLGSDETFNWPRDADRLPSGNTLVTDTKNQRVFEATPEGEIVWEFYAPWLTYEAARVPTGEHNGSAMRDMNATGSYELTESAELHEDNGDLAECHAKLENVEGLTDEGRAFFENQANESQ